MSPTGTVFRTFPFIDSPARRSASNADGFVAGDLHSAESRRDFPERRARVADRASDDGVRRDPVGSLLQCRARVRSTLTTKPQASDLGPCIIGKSVEPRHYTRAGVGDSVLHADEVWGRFIAPADATTAMASWKLSGGTPRLGRLWSASRREGSGSYRLSRSSPIA